MKMTSKILRLRTTIAAVIGLLVLGSLPLTAQVCGSNFKTGTFPTVAFAPSKGTGFTINITSVDGNGAITGSSIGAGGQGYAVGDAGLLKVPVGGDFNINFLIDNVSKGNPNLLDGTVLSFHLQAAFLDLTKPGPALPGDVTNPGPGFKARAQAVTKFELCRPIDLPDACGNLDRGEDYLPRIMARLAADPTSQQAAITSLANVKRSDYGQMGTDGHIDGCSLGDELLASLANLATNATRHGDGDVAMIGFTTILYAYGPRGSNVLPKSVYDHVLHDLIDLSPGPGSVEQLTFGINVVPVCAAICALPGVDLGFGTCAIACPLILGSQSLTVPETENHRNMIYASQYLANQLLFDETKDPRYDNAQNGYRAFLLNRLNDFTRNDFIEYNSHDYQDYSMFALLGLASYTDDPVVKTAAQNVINYISAKVAVSSDDGRRSTPFRRHNQPGSYLCDELVLQQCSDPQDAYYMMLAGVTGALANFPDLASNCASGKGPCLPVNNVPATYANDFQWAATTTYRIPTLILDLFDNPADRKFYQFFHYSRDLQTDGFNDSNDELYYGSPSFLISAGGHPTHNAYTGDLSFPVSLLVGDHPGKDDDLGVDVATTLMPTGALHSREQMLRFANPGGENMCVAPNFACGFLPGSDPNNPNYPQTVDYVVAPPGPIKQAPATGTWYFFDKSNGSVGKVAGYYVMYYTQDNFGFMEVYDTWLNPKGYKTIADFQKAVLANNQSQTFSNSSTDTYTTVDGSVIRFDVDAHIETINGNPPYDPTRTNGTIIDNNNAGTITITNPGLNKSMTLDATRPPNAATISIPGPLNFAGTCVGSTAFQTLNVCNVGTGTENLTVYNIISPNSQTQVTEPTSNYPTNISPDFCYPFQASFAPTVPGAFTTKLTISNSDSISPELQLTVNGTGLQQGIATVIANGGQYGNVCLGSFVDLNLTITNTGGCDLSVTGIGSSSTDFLLASVMSFPLTIHAGGSLSVPIRFQPTTIGAKTANITVMSNDPLNPNAVVTVAGLAQGPHLSVTGTTNFGNVCAGTVQTETYKICNLPTSGKCPLNVTNVALNAGCKDFTIESNPFPEYLGAEQCGNVVVQFTPTSDGKKTCNLVVTSTDPTVPTDVIPLTGTTPIPSVSISPALAFPPTVEGNGKCAVTEPFPVTNTGICPLTINGVTLGPANPEDYGFVDLPKQTNILPPGGSLSGGGFAVRFQPVELNRNVDSSVDVTYISDPILGTKKTVDRNLCGEGVYVGARVLVTLGGVPVSAVDRIQLIQVSTGTVVDSISNAALHTVTPRIAACAPFQFHREYGTVTDKKALAPGSYQAKVTLTIAGKQQTKTVTFTDNSCGFAHPVVVAF